MLSGNRVEAVCKMIRCQQSESADVETSCCRSQLIDSDNAADSRASSMVRRLTQPYWCRGLDVQCCFTRCYPCSLLSAARLGGFRPPLAYPFLAKQLLQWDFDLIWTSFTSTHYAVMIIKRLDVRRLLKSVYYLLLSFKTSYK